MKGTVWDHSMRDRRAGANDLRGLEQRSVTVSIPVIEARLKTFLKFMSCISRREGRGFAVAFASKPANCNFCFQDTHVSM